MIQRANRRRGRGKGWYGERQRHSKAVKKGKRRRLWKKY